MSSLFETTHNPDVLSCIANLSNDEVFTPPELVNQMLDMLPDELWSDPQATFLDPACKSGVFLREIAKRLIKGLADEIPDLDERLEHIYKKQIFGIACTELTSLLSRRSLYCSKWPNSVYSVVKFDDPKGNIDYLRLEHSWENGRCRFCGAAQREYDRDESLEQYAYEFIHLDNPEEVLPVKFDVIIGNPPYQMSTNGSVRSQAVPVYDKFVEQAMRLNPRYLTMITPARWLNGGFGLDKFRERLLADSRFRVIHDYLDSEECFPGVDISGGVCFFLWCRGSKGDCEVFTHRNGRCTRAVRPLLEPGVETFIRENEGVAIFKKVHAFQERSFEDLVSPRDPFGLNYYEDGKEKMFKLIDKKPSSNSVGIYYFGWLKDGIGYTDRSHITTNEAVVDKYKVMISKAYGERGSYPYFIVGKPFVAPPGTCCNMTYLTIGSYDDEETANNVASYIRTKFFRFMVSLLKNTQNAYKKVYGFVPMQDFSKPWTDEELYAKYGLTDEEIAFIESMIRPMDLSGDFDE